jgi:hypothetical protein
LRQKPAIINDVVKAFSLSTAEKEYLLSAVQGSGILISDNDHTELTIVASPEEHKLITTNPNETHVVEKQELVDTGLDADFYLESLLTDSQVHELVNKGYILEKLCDIDDAQKKCYWVKCTPNESAEHGFHVGIVKRELQNRKINFIDNRTVGADIVFKIKEVDYAIEVETGKRFSDFRENKIKKFEDKLKQYGDKLFILITDSDMRPYYERIFPADKILVKSKLRQWLTSLLGSRNNRRK